MTQKRANLYIFIAASLFSIGGLCIKLTPWNPFAINGARSLISSTILFLYLRAQRGKLIFTKGTFLGAFCAFSTTTLYSCANTLTTAANAILIQFVAPVFIILLTWMFFRERPKRLDIVTCVLVFGGIACFVMDGLSGGGMLGNGLALLSGLTYAGIFMMNRMPGGDAFSATIMGQFAGGLVGIPFLFRETDFSTVPLLAVAALGVFQLGLAYIFFCQGIKHTSPVTASLISGIEPILNPLLVAVFVGEMISPIAAVGGVIVLLSITGYNILAAKRAVAAPTSAQQMEIEASILP